MSKENYPDALTTTHIRQILGISTPTAYKLLQKAEDNPTAYFPVRRPVRAYRIGKEGFFRWLNSSQNIS